MCLLLQGNQCQPLGQPAAASAAGQPANSEPAAAVMVNPPQPVLPPIEQPPLGYNNLLGHVDNDFPEVESARQGMLVVRDVLPSVMQSRVLLLSQACILSVSQSLMFIQLALPHSLAQPVTHSLTHSVTHSLAHSFTRSLTHSFTRFFSYSFTHTCMHLFARVMYAQP